LVPLIGIAQFALLVGCAVALRRRASLHKRFMVLAMIGVLGPPVARLVTLAGVGDYWLWIQTTVPALLVIWCLVSDWRKSHRASHLFHRRCAARDLLATARDAGAHRCMGHGVRKDRSPDELMRSGTKWRFGA
jgi:hypothetical protein